jgi:hypothetical protein
LSAGSDSDRIHERDGTLGYVINLQHVPIIVQTWFGAPSVALVDRYLAWLEGFVSAARAGGRRVVLLHDATRAGTPSSEARKRMTLASSSSDVIIDRVIVLDSPMVRGAVSALSWISGSQYRTARSLEEGLDICHSLLERERINPPDAFTLVPEPPSS